MDNNDILNDILAHTAKSKLDKFIREYARENEDFRAVFIELFSPNPKTGSRKKQPEEDYVKTIQKAFIKSGIKSYGRCENKFEDFGFDAGAVSEKLEHLLEKARYYIRHDNREEAICIAQKLIDTIPDYWNEGFDYEGFVQDVYDRAIDLLEEMLKEKLSNDQVESLFSWYEKVIVDKKHDYVGLNTSLEVLEKYFVSDAVGGFDRVLRIINRRIANAGDYEQERAVLEKIYLLVENDREEDADQTIGEFLFYPEVRKIKLKRMLAENRYDQAIELLQEGIVIARKKQETGIESEWLKKLLFVYKQLNNSKKVLEITKELFVQGTEQRACYQSLKKITSKAEWNEMLAWVLRNLSERGFYSSIELKADIFVEHQMWDDLWQLCLRNGIDFLRQYEKHLRPRYEKEILSVYLKYVQQQASMTDKKAYIIVANTLKRMKSFDGGPELVRQLVIQYRQIYKRRIYMMKELDRVKL
ncbi:MAG: hypothetical protein PHS38_13725 [Bacteroidales bacterium]|nr:hypothetical protein [Bacteroidales bacterium]